MMKPAALTAIFAVSSFTLAQDAPPIASIHLPEAASWTMQVRRVAEGDANGANSADLPSRLVRVDFEQFAGLRHGVEHFSDGKKWEWWAKGESLLQAAAQNTGFIVDGIELPKRDSIEAVFSAPGFPGLHWLTPGHYQGEITINSRRCHHFAADLSDGKAEAWIDVETHQPVRIRLGSVIYDVSFGPPPKSRPAIPPQAIQEMQTVEALQKRAVRALEAGRR